jgi:hypothetical protein
MYIYRCFLSWPGDVRTRRLLYRMRTPFGCDRWLSCLALPLTKEPSAHRNGRDGGKKRKGSIIGDIIGLGWIKKTSAYVD